MKRLALLAMLVLLGSGFSVAQELDPDLYPKRSRNKNHLYGELIGSTFGLGLSYERTVVSDTSIQLNVRVGTGTIIFVNAVPLVGMNILIGKKENLLEIGANGIRTYAFGILGGESTYLLVNPVIGYRYQGASGFIFRATFTPMIEAYDPDDWVSNDRPFLPLAGISLGFSF